MAKKQQAPDAIIKQFEKPQFKIDDAVFFTWLGAKKYGYVKTYKTSSWGIQYLVESNDTRYPCGISIKGHKTAYTTGCINIDETRSIGQDEIKKRGQLPADCPVLTKPVNFSTLEKLIADAYAEVSARSPAA